MPSIEKLRLRHLVGSVNTTDNARPLINRINADESWRAHQTYRASCMRGPPELDTITNGSLRSIAFDRPRIFSPTTDPTEPMNFIPSRRCLLRPVSLPDAKSAHQKAASPPIPASLSRSFGSENRSGSVDTMSASCSTYIIVTGSPAARAHLCGMKPHLRHT